KAERAPRHLGHARKATIELDRVEFSAVSAGKVHDCFQYRILRMALIELVAQEIVAWLLSRRTAERVDQTILRDSSGAGFRQARQHHRRAHVYAGICDHELGVGPRNQPVLWRWRRDFRWRKMPFQPTIGISGCDVRKARP